METGRSSFRINKELRDQNILVLNFDAHKVPIFVEEKNKDWVIYGKDKDWNNRYCDYLLQLFNRSAKHNAITTAKTHYIAGNGFDIDDTGLKLEDKARLSALINRANKYEETLQDVEYKCALDVEIFGGYYKEICWNKSGNDFDIYHMDFTKLRRSKEDDGYWYSENWAAKKQDEKPVDEGGTALEFIPDFDIENPKGNQIFTYKEYRPGVKWYPLPGYIGAIPYAEIDFEISNFHLNNIKSGFNAGTIINFANGRPTDTEKETVEELLKKKFTSTDRAGSLLITFSNGKDAAPTVEHMTPSDMDKQFDLLNKTTQQELFTGHRITSPMLFGVKEEGQLGGISEISVAYDLFKKTYSQQKQDNLNREINFLLAKKGIAGKLKLKEVTPLQDKVDLADLIKVMSANEIRKMGGLDDVEGGDAYPFITNEVKPVVSSSVHHFTTVQDDEDADIFLEFGADKSEYDILTTLESQFTSQDECFENEVKQYSFDIVGEDVKMIYKNIIDLMSKNPLISPEEIAKALKVTPAKVNAAIDSLVKDKLVSTGKDEKWQVSDSGNEIIKGNTPTTAKMQIMYSYEKRPGVTGAPLLATSRPFCVKLYNSNKLFTRQEIETISSRVGYDVWEMRGGWWRKNKNTLFPFCRHVFMQHLVKKK